MAKKGSEHHTDHASSWPKQFYTQADMSKGLGSQQRQWNHNLLLFATYFLGPISVRSVHVADHVFETLSHIYMLLPYQDSCCVIDLSKTPAISYEIHKQSSQVDK